MAYGTNYAPQYGVPGYNAYPTTYTPPALPYQQPRMDYQQMAQQPQQQPGTIFARIVTGREEAVAAQVLPDGNINAFIDRAHGRVYLKQVNPQTGVADFAEFVDVRQIPQPATPQPEVPQYVTLDAFNALRGDVDQIKAAMAQPAPRQKKGADAE